MLCVQYGRGRIQLRVRMAAPITSGFNVKEAGEVGRMCAEDEDMEDGSGAIRRST